MRPIVANGRRDAQIPACSLRHYLIVPNERGSIDAAPPN